jgi:vesicle-fusing ATPase
VIDNIERLIEFVHAGPDFNNHVLQTMMTLIQKIPPNPECRLLIVGTSSNYDAMDLLDIKKVFSLKLEIP